MINYMGYNIVREIEDRYSSYWAAFHEDTVHFTAVSKDVLYSKIDKENFEKEVRQGIEDVNQGYTYKYDDILETNENFWADCEPLLGLGEFS